MSCPFPTTNAVRKATSRHQEPMLEEYRFSLLTQVVRPKQ